MLSWLLLAVASTTIAFAGDQHVHLHGIVRDSTTGAPIADVIIAVIGRPITRQSNRGGQFDIDQLERGTYRIGFRRLGYYDRVTTLTLERDTSIVVYLVPLGVQLQSVVVESMRTGAIGTEHAELLATPQLDRHRGQTFGELVEQLPTVALLQTGTAIAKPVVRGLHSQRVVISSGGIQHQAQEWGLDHGPAIDPFLPASIAVVSGAASIEDSYAAIGGVIRIEQPQLEFHQPFNGKASLVASSNNGMGAASILARGSDLLIPNTAYLVHVGGHIAGDSRTPAYVLSNTGSRQLSTMVALGVDAGSWRHSVSYSFFTSMLGILAAAHIGNVSDLERAIASGSPLIVRPWTYSIGNPRQQILHQTLHAESIYSGDAGTLEFRYGWQRNDRSEYDAHNTRYLDSTALRQALQRPALELSLASYQLDVRYRRPERNGSTTVGLHLLRQSNTRIGNVFLVPDFLLYEGGVLGIHTQSVGPWMLSVGIRGDVQWVRARPYNRARGIAEADSTLFYAGIAAHAGVERLLWAGSLLQINMSTHWRPPAPVELYANDLHHGTAQFEIGNRQLRTERSYSLDVRLKSGLGPAVVDISFYGMYLPRFTQLLPDSVPTLTYRGAFPTMRYSQRQAVLYGGELIWSIPLDAQLRIDGNVALVRGRDVADGQWIPFLPADRARIALHWHTERLGPFREAFTEFAARAIRRQTAISPATFDYAAPPPGYLTLELTAGGTLNVRSTPVSVSLSVTNLFDQPYRDYLSRYRYFALDPGRNLILRLSVPFGLFHQSS